MRRSFIIIIALVCLIAGIAGGYSTGYISYGPKSKSLEIEVSYLKSQNDDQEARISTLESDNSSLQTSLSTALDTTQEQAQQYEQRIIQYVEQVNELKSEIESSQDRLSNILEVEVTLHYSWDYSHDTYSLSLAVPLSVFVENLERTRPQTASRYTLIAQDSFSQKYIDQVVWEINSIVKKNSYNDTQKLSLAIAFVRSLPYKYDNETTRYDEYPRYPIETLFIRGGDCEDTSILLSAILDRLEYDVALIVLPDAQHMAVGILSANLWGSYYNYNNKKYFYVETTVGENWPVGKIPTYIKDTYARVYPLES